MANYRKDRLVTRLAAAATVFTLSACGGASQESVNRLATSVAILDAKIDDQSVASATPSPEATAPAARATAEATVAPEVVKTEWPTTPEEAAKLFGSSKENWEPTAEGKGWHLIEQHDRVEIKVPEDVAMEAYYDKEPGRDPYQFVASGTIVTPQGGTVWPTTGDEVFCAMLAQKYPGINFDQAAKLIDVMGFKKPGSCPTAK